MAIWPVFGPKELTPEASEEMFSVGALGKREDEHILVGAPQRVRPGAERQSFTVAEEADREVAVAEASVGWERDLVWPLPIHHALAHDHANPSFVPTALNAAPRGRTWLGAAERGRRLMSVAD